VNRLTIRTKIFLSTGLASAVFVLALAVEFVYLNREIQTVRYTSDTVDRIRTDAGIARRWLLYAETRRAAIILATPGVTQVAFRKYAVAVRELYAAVTRLDASPLSAADRQVLEDFKTWMTGYELQSNRAFNSVLEGRRAEAERIYATVPPDPGEAMIDRLRADVGELDRRAGDALLAGAEQTKAVTALAGCIAIVIGFAVAALVARSLARRMDTVVDAMQSAVDVELTELVQAMRRIAKGEPSGIVPRTRRTLDVDGDDEAARLARAYNALLDALHSADRELATTGELLDAMIAQIKRTAESKMQFSATLSHEIRTPLSGIVGVSELLQGTGLDERQRRYAETIDASAQALLHIVNEVLDFSKSEATTLHVQPTHFSLRALVEGATAGFSVEAARKGIDLAAHVGGSLEGALYGDAGRLRQILGNLVSNAIKFTDRGRVIVEAAEEARDGASVRVRFTVSDSGIGIPPSEQARIFEPFVQAGGPDAYREGGTGLGLAIVRRLVQLLGGHVTLSSEPGRGSRFTFALPFERQGPAVGPQGPSVDSPEPRMIRSG
jgi:signal transduction histidine kinase